MVRHPSYHRHIPPRAARLGAQLLRQVRSLAVSYRRPSNPGRFGDRRDPRPRVLLIDRAPGGGALRVVRVWPDPTIGRESVPDVCSVPTETKDCPVKGPATSEIADTHRRTVSSFVSFCQGQRQSHGIWPARHQSRQAFCSGVRRPCWLLISISPPRPPYT